MKFFVQPGKSNVDLDHLSQLESQNELTYIDVNLPDSHLFRIESVRVEIAKIMEFLHIGKAPEGLS